ncbi:MAG: hypothetical protein ACRD2C_23900 [Acidimicrobiales bacterium]
MTDRIELVQDVVVFDVGVDDVDQAVLVDLYGGSSNACGTVRFLLSDQAGRDAAIRVLDRWRQQETPLTLVARGTTVALQNDQALFGSQLGTAGLTPDIDPH